MLVLYSTLGVYPLPGRSRPAGAFRVSIKVYLEALVVDASGGSYGIFFR